MSNRTRALLATIPFIVFMVIVIAFGVVRTFSRGEVLSSVAVLGTDIGGMNREEAIESLTRASTEYENRALEFIVSDVRTNLDASTVGYQLDVDATVERALQRGRTGNALAQLGWWLGHLNGSDALLPVASLDPDLLTETLRNWNVSLVGDLPDPGGITVEEGDLVATNPTAGRRIDRQRAEQLMITAFSETDTEPTELPVREAVPPVTEEDIARVLNQAELMVSAPVTLTNGDNTIRLERSDLIEALKVSTDPVSVTFDSEVLADIVARFNLGTENPALDAFFEPNGYDITIRSGRPGTRVDFDELASTLLLESRTAARQGELPYDEYAPPAVTTEDLEALAIDHLISEFTTGFDCCEGRVTNIQLIADEIDGTIIGPGENFSLNEAAGRRTADKGYVEAGTIVRGEITDTVGGGVSQFATTFYNAAFWGGFEIVSHKPHSFYFGRYPEGIEATVSWPSPDLVIRNNSETAIYIDTSYGETTITVRIYGDNDGRAVSGYQSSEGPAITVLEEGGSEARVVEGGRTDRFAFTEPPEPKYRANPELAETSEVITQYPREGWTVTVHRSITANGESETEEWPVTYIPQQQIIEVHPCNVPGSSVPCESETQPTAPTTTLPDDTTPPTTAPPTTTPPTTTPPSTTPPTTAPPNTTAPPSTMPPTTDPPIGTD